MLIFIGKCQAYAIFHWTYCSSDCEFTVIDRRPKRYLIWKPEVKKPVSQPFIQWIEGVNIDLNNRGTSVQEVKLLKGMMTGSTVVHF